MSKQAQRTIYLDYAAATPLDDSVQQVMAPYLAKRFYNPSASYIAARKVKADTANARKQVASHLGTRPGEIIFTSGGTEANNLAIHGILQRFVGAHIVISAIEHESVRLPASRYKYTEVPVNSQGIIDMDALARSITDETALISVMYANNEIGTVQPIRSITALVQTVRAQRIHTGNDLPLYVHTDAAQATNYLDLHVSRLGVDMLSLGGGKIYGPKQSGMLYVKAGITLQSQLLGGGQENGLRSGTENVPGIIGFAQALTKAQNMHNSEAERLAALQRNFIDKLCSALPQCQINGSLKKRLPNNISVTVPGQDNERLLIQLDEHGIMCATGSACSASKKESSHVLSALGLDEKTAQATLRFTMGRGTTARDVDQTVSQLAALVTATT